MPVVALVGAAASISAGVAIGVTTLTGGLMVAGGALTAIGTITGNKKVAALGALMGLGAGVANAVSGAGNAASGAGEFSAASADPMANLELTSGGATGGLGEMVDATGGLETATNYTPPDAGGMVTTGLGEMVDATGGMETAVDSPTGDFHIGRESPEKLNEFVKSQIPEETKPRGPADMAKETTEAPKQEPMKFDDNREPGGNSAGTGDDSRLLTKDSTTGKAKGRMAEVMDWVRDPKNAALIKTGGGLVAAGMKGLSDQKLLKQKAALEEEIKSRDRARLNDSIRGMVRYA